MRWAAALLAGLGADSVDLTWGAMVRRSTPQQPENLVPGVRNLIAVASGKGGVGKTNIVANLFGFDARPYFETEGDERSVPEVGF